MSARRVVHVGTSYSDDETEGFAVELAQRLSRPCVIGLIGELGAGKTCFTRGFAQALTPEDADLVSSPTYALVNRYEGEVPVHHLDLYRLQGEDDLESVAFFDLIDEGWTLIEWPDRVPAALQACEVIVQLSREPAAPDTRIIHVYCDDVGLLEPF